MDVHMESPPVGVPAPIYPSAPTSPEFELPEILLTIPSGVVLYYITKDGNAVTTLPSQTFLQIFRSPNYQELGSDEHPVAYLVVRNGEWSYPLIPRKSPVFLSKSGIYTFPDPSFGETDQNYHAVAIVFDPQVSEANKKLFKDVIDATSILKREGESGGGGGSGNGGSPDQRTFTETAVLKGAELIGKGIVIGAKVAEYGMQKGAEAAQKYMEPEPGKKIDPKIVKGVEYAKRGSEVTKFAAGKVEGWVGDATRSVGRSLARLVFGKDGGDSSSGSSSTMQQIKWILKLGLQGLGVVFAALEEAKEILKKSIKSETVKVVDYKYGPEASVVAGVAADAFGNIVDTADSAMGVGLSKKTFAKKMVKKTGKEMAKEAVRSSKEGEESGVLPTVGTDDEGRFVLSNAPEAAPKVLDRVKRGEGGGSGAAAALAASGSPERSRSPLPTPKDLSFSALRKKEAAAKSSTTTTTTPPPPRPTSLPPTAPPPPMPMAPSSGAAVAAADRQRHARFTDDEVEALLALAPTPTHDTIHHALDLPTQRRNGGGGGNEAAPTATNDRIPTRDLYPKI